MSVHILMERFLVFWPKINGWALEQI